MEVLMASGVRRWVTGVGLAGGVAVAAAMIGAAGSPIARADVGDAGAASAATDLATSVSAAADTPNEVLDQAANNLNQGTSVLDTASPADLSAYQASVLSIQEGVGPNQDSGLTDLASLQDTLPATDQTSLANVDEQLVSASQSILSADQAFLAADKAGDLSSSSFLPVDWTIISADLDYLGADLNAGGATFLDLLTGGLDASSAADLASSLDPATAVDPSIFADVLSSIGL
jgi:hypothetical protein